MALLAAKVANARIRAAFFADVIWVVEVGYPSSGGLIAGGSEGRRGARATKQRTVDAMLVYTKSTES